MAGSSGRWRSSTVGLGLPIDLNTWNRVLLLACLVSVFVDPLFLFVAAVRAEETCVERRDRGLEVALTLLRSMADAFYIMHILIRFRFRFTPPYLLLHFCLDFLAALPLPQVYSLSFSSLSLNFKKCVSLASRNLNLISVASHFSNFNFVYNIV